MSCMLGEKSSNKIGCNISISNSIGNNISSQETCLICGDIASGKHYGLRSCEACKAFFKRTVQGKIEYSCPATKECEINKRRRKACQACRFQKCLNMGMLKEGVRLDRVRGGRQKYRRGLSPGPQQPGPSSSAVTNVDSETNRIMAALINSEPELLTASSPECLSNLPSSLSGQMKTLYILSYLFDQELVSLIGWAKQIPGFSETIMLNDQMRLLQSTWGEVIALSICYRSHLSRKEYQNRHPQQKSSISSTATSSPTSSSSPASNASSYNSGNNGNQFINNHHLINGSSEGTVYHEISLVFAKDLMIDFNHAVACGAEEIFYNCVQLIKRLDNLKITQKEYMILKALSLANADVRLENLTTTHQLRDLIMDTLYEVTIADSTNQRPMFFSSITSSSASVPFAESVLGTSLSCNTSNNNNTLTIGSQRDAQDRSSSSTISLSSATTSPPRPSSSMPSSSSLSSISTNNAAVSLVTNKRTVINHRLNQLLLCLPVLRQIDSSIRKFWNDIRRGPNTVPMKSLFEEMLEPVQKVYKSPGDM